MYEPNPWDEPTLPEDIEAELHFLSTVLWNAEMMYEYSLTTQPEYFHKPQHRLIWNAACSLVSEGTEISASAVKDRLGKDLHKAGGWQGVTDAFGGEPVERPEVLWNIIKSKAEARQSLIALEKALETIRRDGAIGSTLDNVRSLADAFAPRQTPIRSYTDLFESMEAGNGALPIDRANNLPVFGIDSLDRTVGAMAGTLGVVAAKTSAGKSSLAYQICIKSAMRGRKVLLVSLEADREEVSAALAANMNEMNRGTLLRTGADGVNVHGIVKSNVHGYHAGSGATWETIEKAIRVEHGRSPFQVILIDYFTLLQPPDFKGRNMASLYGEISKAAKRVSQQLACSVILLSQFNRGIEDGQEPFLENLRETGQLEQDADWVVLLWAKPEDEPEGFRYVNAKVAKNRKGKRGEKFRMKLFPAESRFIVSDTEVESFKSKRRMN